MASQAARSSASPSEENGASSERARPSFTSSLPAIPDNVGRLRRGVCEFARRHGASERSLQSVTLATSEAITNAVMHAYRDAAEPGLVLVRATIEDSALLVTVADEGCGMTARYDGPGSGLGRGMAIMAMLADTFEIGRRITGRSGVQLRLRFDLAT
jgi:serine/threonine-protein kinase RsbW